MNKGDLIEAIAKGSDLTKADAGRALDATIEAITKTLKKGCLLYTSPSPRDRTRSRMPSSA